MRLKVIVKSEKVIARYGFKHSRLGHFSTKVEICQVGRCFFLSLYIVYISLLKFCRIQCRSMSVGEFKVYDLFHMKDIR